MLDVNNKFPESEKTFETRILFIQDIFINKYSKTEIMAKCVQHKLKRSFESYEADVKRSMADLVCANPLTVLKRLK